MTDSCLRDKAGLGAEFVFAVFRLIFASRSGRPRWKDGFLNSQACPCEPSECVNELVLLRASLTLRHRN